MSLVLCVLVAFANGIYGPTILLRLNLTKKRRAGIALFACGLCNLLPVQ
jgi:hypothetical protein